MPKFRVIQEWVSHSEAEIEADNYREAKHKALNDDSIQWEDSHDRMIDIKARIEHLKEITNERSE